MRFKISKMIIKRIRPNNFKNANKELREGILGKIVKTVGGLGALGAAGAVGTGIGSSVGNSDYVANNLGKSNYLPGREQYDKFGNVIGAAQPLGITDYLKNAAKAYIPGASRFGNWLSSPSELEATKAQLDQLRKQNMESQERLKRLGVGDNPELQDKVISRAAPLGQEIQRDISRERYEQQRRQIEQERNAREYNIRKQYRSLPQQPQNYGYEAPPMQNVNPRYYSPSTQDLRYRYKRPVERPPIPGNW